MINFILARLTEASTWRGLIAIATAAGVQFSPDKMAVILTTGLTIIGAIGAFLPDSKAVKEAKEIGEAIEQAVTTPGEPQ